MTDSTAAANASSSSSSSAATTSAGEDSDQPQFALPKFDGKLYGNPLSFASFREPPSLFNPFAWGALFRWKFCEKKPSMPKEEELQRCLPVRQAQFHTNSPLSITWLGHASCFVHIDGLSLLTDPVWSDYASPLSWYGCPRYRPPPCKIEELPEIHAVLISHNHYDHLDHKTVKLLADRFPNCSWFVPRGLARWMREAIGDNGQRVEELNWGEQALIETPDGKSHQIMAVPAQHWSQRGIFDRNKSLWAGWLVQGAQGHKFLFTGDTGFCEEEFRKLGKRFGPVDLAAIPIGCYSPRWFMEPQHINTDEAVQIHQLCRVRKSIAIHWGTYDMGSTEPCLEPPAKLKEAMEKRGVAPDAFSTLEHGGSWHIEEEEDE